MKKITTILTCVAFLFVAGAVLPGCEKKAETPGEKMDEAIEDGADAVDDAKDDAKKVLEDK